MAPPQRKVGFRSMYAFFARDIRKPRKEPKIKKKTRFFDAELLAKQRYPPETQRVVEALREVIAKYPEVGKEEIALRTYGLVEEWRKQKRLVSSLNSSHLISPTAIRKFISQLEKARIINEK